MTLELKIPPVAVLLIAVIGMAMCARLWPPAAEPVLAIGATGAALPLFLPLGDGAASILGGLLTVKGIAVALLGVREFRRERTTVDPRSPGRAAALVTGGIFTQTRNPMYFGMLLCLAALAIWLRSLPAFLFLPLFVLYLNRYQIAPEERAMEEHFGNAFRRYCSRVRRWI
ncbi:MAG: isoprenylcysteine carboxylmethyltransferase family protein [Halieaceae bacterium]|jgi:protein-S-isoprenylcysteine O-methyltransferase Ste14|nr:isoprenylcysteine carboxylmethyltransferase family protein [Halieaceae bacterium]